MFQFITLTFLFITLSGIFFTLFAEQNLLLSVIYIEISFVTIVLLMSFFARIIDDFYLIASSIIVLVLAAGDSVIAISLLVYLNRSGSFGGLSYLKHVLLNNLNNVY
jgi:NADH:ubiquinone oxidoreductase subunit K